MNYNLDFSGKTVLITGAASGIGLECTEAFLQNGARVLMTDCNEELLKNQAELFSERYGKDSVIFYTADITDSESIRAMVEEISRSGKGVDILLNNAGISHKQYSANEKAEDWSRVININLTAQFFVAQTVANTFFIPKKQGKLINMCSLGGILGIPAATAYSASKGGLIQVTKSLAYEWARFGITVNAVCPGFVETPLIAGDMENEKWLKYIKMRTPMHRLARADDVAGAVLFLSSHMADYITGSTLIVDGGMSVGA